MEVHAIVVQTQEQINLYDSKTTLMIMDEGDQLLLDRLVLPRTSKILALTATSENVIYL